MACLDGAGTFVFALSGAVLGVQKRFDIFGVLFLSWVVGVVGGIPPPHSMIDEAKHNAAAGRRRANARD